MQIEVPFEFSKDLNTIYQSFLNPDFLTAKYESVGDRNIKIDINKEVGKTTIKTTMEVAIEAPGPLKKMLKSWNTVNITEVWTGTANESYHCDLEVHTEGVPLVITNKLQLSTSGSGCTSKSVMEAKSTVPLVGKVLEKFAIDASVEALKKEFAFIEANA